MLMSLRCPRPEAPLVVEAKAEGLNEAARLQADASSPSLIGS
jgi:hypothetical protein